MRKDLLRRVACALPKYLAEVLQAAKRDAVVALVLRQLEHGEMACPAFCEQVAALPTEPEARESRVREWVDRMCRDAAASRYVLDCERVARFLAPGASEAQRREIVRQFHLEYAACAYGPVKGKPSDEPRGYLGARLIKTLGEREARVVFGQAQQMLDERVFSLDGFGRCAEQYDPRQGKTFDHFFRKQIRWRANDVVDELLGRSGRVMPRIVEDGPGIDEVTAGLGKPLEEEQPVDPAAELRRGLERYCLEHKNRQQTELEVAVFELWAMAYRDPEEMMPSTRRLVASHLPRLTSEFFHCQERLGELEMERDIAHHRCEKAARELEDVRRRLEQGGYSTGLDELECEATARNITEMEAEWKDLGEGDREGPAGWRLAYQIAWRRLALAKGTRERAKLEIAKWEACRKPWVRSEVEIGRLLGISQATVSRYLTRIKCALGGIENPSQENTMEDLSEEENSG